MLEDGFYSEDILIPFKTFDDNLLVHLYVDKVDLTTIVSFDLYDREFEAVINAWSYNNKATFFKLYFTYYKGTVDSDKLEEDGSYILTFKDEFNTIKNAIIDMFTMIDEIKTKSNVGLQDYVMSYEDDSNDKTYASFIHQIACEFIFDSRLYVKSDDINVIKHWSSTYDTDYIPSNLIKKITGGDTKLLKQQEDQVKDRTVIDSKRYNFFIEDNREPNRIIFKPVMELDEPEIKIKRVVGGDPRDTPDYYKHKYGHSY